MAGIYLHIPFCKQACVYCNFHFSTSGKNKNDLLSAMLRELEMQRHYLDGETIDTIYFGGGTPSILTSDEINMFLKRISELYPINEIKECTLEANPDDISTSYLKKLRNTLINRLSIGVQSFREQDLLLLKRAHNAQQAEYSIKAAQDAGFTNLNIDLIYGIPGLSDKDWKNNLAITKDFMIPHFSAYALTVENKTALHHAIQNRKIDPVEPEQAATQFEILMEQVAIIGYEHYEISNFAKPGKHAIHNTNYWLGSHYIGIGPSAHSFNGTSRKWNISNNSLYTQSILRDNKINFEEEKLTSVQQLNEYIMTSLRTMWGCDLDKITKEWGSDFASSIEKTTIKFKEKDLMQIDGRKIKLTNKGKLFADNIAAEMFV